MKRALTFVVLLPVVLALIVSPTMNGGIGPSFLPSMICDSPPMHMDGIPCSPSWLWVIIALLLVNTTVALLAVLTLANNFRRMQHADQHLNR